MKTDSAPGPDGFTVEFFMENWEVVGLEVTQAVEYFFTNDYLYYPINTTAISLIPKTENPVKMKEFRPIFCCIVTYKNHI